MKRFPKLGGYMMKNLSAFMHGLAKPVENIFYAASERMIDPETEKPAEWEIRCLTADENARIRKACFKSVPMPGGRKGQYTQEFDANEYQRKVAVECTVFPDLLNAELQDSYKVNGAEKLITTMFTPGEYEDYCAKVLELNGFTFDKSELVDEAKN